ncbi:MAG: transglycosylase domain-containing protein, partial [Calditrichota bacterium]
PGGSTITQQLAKNLFFTFKRSWERKLLEGLAALAIEDCFSKQEILETYVNLIYYGRYAYGIELASQTYFGKHAAELKVEEAALLAGLPNSPSRLNPYVHPDQARDRQRIVLERMARVGMILESAVDSLAARSWKLNRRPMPEAAGSHAIDYALERAGEQIGDDLVGYGGVRIYTTIDPVLQNIAEGAVELGVRDLEERLKTPPEKDNARLEGALVAIEVASGNILALAGSRDYLASQYNRAVYSFRQPGSSFKPVIYLTALDRLGLNAAALVEDKPVQIKLDNGQTWNPSNFSNSFIGPLILKLALMKSINTISAQLIERVTPAAVVTSAYALGVTTKLDPYYSLALGAQGLPPIEMANVFTTIAREGVYRDLTLVSRIEGPGRDLLYESMTAAETRFPAETVYQLIDMMTGVFEVGGTGAVVRRLGFKGVAIGKTGTSSDYKDSWFNGATPSLTAIVWVGYDDNRPMKMKNGVGVTGASSAAPIWADFMIRATEGEPVRNFPRPLGIERAYAHPTTGRLSAEPVEGYLPVALTSENFTSLKKKIIAAPPDTIRPPETVDFPVDQGF